MHQSYRVAGFFLLNVRIMQSILAQLNRALVTLLDNQPFV